VISNSSYKVLSPGKTTNFFISDIKGGTGFASALFINDAVPLPVPSAGQALVKIQAFGLNRMDIMQRRGEYNVRITSS
jgi:hypothetical protein